MVKGRSVPALAPKTTLVRPDWRARTVWTVWTEPVRNLDWVAARISRV